MIAVDTNTLVYAYRKDAEWHAIAYARIAQWSVDRDFGRFPDLMVVNPLVA